MTKWSLLNYDVKANSNTNSITYLNTNQNNDPITKWYYSWNTHSNTNLNTNSTTNSNTNSNNYSNTNSNTYSNTDSNTNIVFASCPTEFGRGVIPSMVWSQLTQLTGNSDIHHHVVPYNYISCWKEDDICRNIVGHF